jgi:hypothetical protein
MIEVIVANLAEVLLRWSSTLFSIKYIQQQKRKNSSINIANHFFFYMGCEYLYKIKVECLLLT